MEQKLLFTLLAIVLTFIGFYPYIRGVLKNSIKPHFFSWLIWSLVTLVVFVAQLKEGGGLGAWPIGISGLITVVVAVLAFLKKADVKITRTDWGFLILALSSLPFWYVTSDPFWAVLILSTVEVLGFGPTLTKAYHLPYEENITFFVLFMIRNLLSIVALERLTVTTVMFPAVGAGACVILIVTLVSRRRLKN